MYPNLMDVYGNLQSMSKETTDQVAAQSAKVTSLVQECYQVWLNVMAESMGETTKAVQDLAVCKSPVEAAEVQRAYMETMSAKTMANVQKLMELTNTMVGSLVIPTPAGTPANLTEKRAAPAVRSEKPVAPAPSVAPQPAAVPVAAPPVVSAPPSSETGNG